jgi:hypothetical protein
MKGYFKFAWVFLGCIAIWTVVLLGAAMIVVAISPPTSGQQANNAGAALMVFTYPLSILCCGLLAYGACKNVGFGMGWSKIGPILASVLIAFTGLIGFIIVQMLAMEEMKRYGAKGGFIIGARKKDVLALIAKRRAQENQTMATPPGATGP